MAQAASGTVAACHSGSATGSRPVARVLPRLSFVGKLYAHGGLIRFYRGFVPCLLRSVPANGAMLLTVGHALDRALVPHQVAACHARNNKCR